MLNLDYLRKIAEEARKIAEPIRTTRVTIRTRVWAQAIGRGSPVSVTDFALPAYVKVKVKNVSNQEVASSGGQLLLGDVVVGPITPAHASGGLTIDQIEPKAPDKLTEIVYVLTGAITGEYRRISDETHAPIHYMLTLRRTNAT